MLSPLCATAPGVQGAELHPKGLGPARPPLGAPHAVPLRVGQRLEEEERSARQAAPHPLPVSLLGLLTPALKPQDKPGGHRAAPLNKGGVVPRLRAAGRDQQPGPEPSGGATPSSREGTGHAKQSLSWQREGRGTHTRRPLHAGAQQGRAGTSSTGHVGVCRPHRPLGGT